MKTIRLTMAQALVRFLENQYIAYDGIEHPFVEGVIMLPGHGNVVGLGQALAQEAHRMQVWQGKNEQGMAHTAVAFAKQCKRKKIIAVTSSVGPGAANMVTAAATATANNIPVLILPGDVYACRQPDPVLQQVEQTHDLSLSTNDAFRPVCRYWDRVVRPEQLMSAMLSAMRVLTDPANTGAVCVAMPQDVEGEAYDYPESFFARRVHRLARREPEAEVITEAAEIIKNAKKPMLICGGGVRYSEAHEEFKHFAEATGIPFAETQAGKSAVVWDHPLNLGGVGVTGCSAANEIAREADVVIGVGTRYTDFTTASKWLFREDARFVNINVSEFQALKLDALPVVADAKKALPALLAAVGSYKAPYTTEVAEARARWRKELDRLDATAFGEGYVPEINDANAQSAFRFAKDLDASLTQTEVLGCINRCIDPEDVVIGAAGSLPGDMQRMWRPRAVDTYNMEYGYSCMGYEISGALGVKYAIGDRDVYAMCGDGSFIMLHAELLTAVQEHKKIHICLFNNASYGCINNLQVGHGNDTLCTELRWRGEDGKFSGPFMPVDFAKIAEGYGCKAYTIHSLAELKDAIADAKKIDGVPVLFDIRVLPKSMTDGYGAWWRVGDTAVSENQRNLDAYQDHLAHEKDARKY
ncbi:MAG: 3D-(3,5/4)-trihydroxycyclohexane-1,2-dione acylhydrolase (decyclizing) [Oscillospiraceae bacterium]|jgi:3D-(3,5/4)-trihydroxycyclohexane-1,2-dione acylhydrolase (decyclizing)|nr:3D-(3,5/4)-trihydroxycyclohexane-1,2-dione acylhydrolase (decyclizing) [Oscillospiraceae bacterium]